MANSSYVNICNKIINDFNNDNIKVKLGNNKTCLKEKNIYINGEFFCKNCNKKWVSGKIYTEIYHNNENSFYLKIYYQRCKKCNNIKKPSINNVGKDKIKSKLELYFGYRDVIINDTIKKTKPHMAKYCEACKIGKCEENIDKLFKHLYI